MVKVVIKYVSSQAPHMMAFTGADMRAAKKDGGLHIESSDPAKTLTISGSPSDLRELGHTLIQAAS